MGVVAYSHHVDIWRHTVASRYGADQASIWVTERAANKIAKLNLSGTLLGEYALPGTCGLDPNDIALASDGNMYFTQDPGTGGTGHLGQITPSGTITCFNQPDNGDTTGVSESPDGNIWTSEYTAARIVKFNVTTDTFAASIAVPSPAGDPQVMARGEDGEMWFVTIGPYMVSFQPN